MSFKRRMLSVLAHIGVGVLLLLALPDSSKAESESWFDLIKTILVVMLFPFIYMHTSRSGFLNKILFVLMFVCVIATGVCYALLGFTYIFTNLTESELNLAENFAFCSTMVVWFILFKKTATRISDDDDPTLFSTVTYYLVLVGTPFLFFSLANTLVEISILRIISKVYTAGGIALIFVALGGGKELGEDSGSSSYGGNLRRYELADLLSKARAHGALRCDYTIKEGSGKFVVVINGFRRDAQSLMNYIESNTERDCSNVSVTYRTDDYSL